MILPVKLLSANFQNLSDWTFYWCLLNQDIYRSCVQNPLNSDRIVLILEKHTSVRNRKNPATGLSLILSTDQTLDGPVTNVVYSTYIAARVYVLPFTVLHERVCAPSLGLRSN